MNTKIKYLASSLRKRVLSQNNHCPSCGYSTATVIERKYLVTDLRRCTGCALLFRTPTTSHQENQYFYQKDYAQGFTTEVPNDDQLNDYLSAGFANSEKDFTSYLKILEALGAKPKQSILDYGCSWGYGSWQFQAAGYRVTGFEVSRPRCEFAHQRLGIDAKNSLSDIQGKFDIIFSAHVIEHLPAVSDFLEFAQRHLVGGGLLVTICPNGSETYRSFNRKNYKRLWGLVHPQMLDEEYYRKYFGDSNLYISSTPYDYAALSEWNHKDLQINSLKGSELLCIWKQKSGSP